MKRYYWFTAFLPVLLAVFLIGIVIAKIKYISRGRKARGGK